MLKKILLFFTIFWYSNFAFSQTNEIRIKFIGNCGLHLTDGKSNLYIDFPYKSGAYGYMNYEISEIDNIKDNSTFLFTHRHDDHYSKEILKDLKSKHSSKIYGNWNVKKLDNLYSSFDDFEITAFKTKHKFTFNHFSYLITWHGKNIYISGDTVDGETISKVKNIDWAFMPYWLLLDTDKKNLKIDAKNIGIYHLYPNQKFNNSSPDKIKLLDKQGEIITIPF
ncbi:MBL fold metallo-hydrolase [Faecalibacter rhinopitheci]|uniref:MBL fold metallo-hydrolase n=1 Tax=Faecalibacter rhinopitheci TaxID=2779678 RepID=A0A8J7FPP6_9FLAO|nr:MBL fold metallo-hydrolase [Faecalibacter rhinopitheci]MBF0598432.1 MBL fold metallo-hydrolase [Faecalibacter rhinopitheci]